MSASSLRKVLTTTGHTLQSAATAAGATAAVASVLIGTSVVNAVTGRVQSALKIAATQASKNRTTPKVSAAQKASGAAAQAKQQLTASNKVQRESVTQTTGGIIASCSGYKAAQTKSAEEFISELLNATVKVEKGVVLSTDKNASGRLVMPAGTYTPQEFIMYVNQNGDEQARRELTSAISAGGSVETALQSYVAMHKETAILSAWESSVWEKTGQVIEQAILGDYAENRTAIGTAAQIAVSFIPGVDTVTDIRDASYSFQELRNHPSWHNVGWAALDLVGFIPLIGNVKYLKHADDAVDAAGMLAKHGDEFVDAASSVGKHADDVVDVVFQQGKKVLENFDTANAYVKPKHLATTGGNGAKFIAETKKEAEKLVRNVMTNGTIKEVYDNGITSAGNKSYEIIIDAGEVIGTKGETLLKIVLSEDGGMLSAYPIK